MDVPTLLLGVAIGVLLTLAAPPLFFLVVGLFAKTVGSKGCNVCDHYPNWKPGAHTNLRFYAHRLWHDIVWERRKWHRQAWKHHRWNREGSGVHSDYPYEVTCLDADHTWMSIRGPYSSFSDALVVGQKHDRAQHGGQLMTTVVGKADTTTFPETAEEVDL